MLMQKRTKRLKRDTLPNDQRRATLELHVSVGPCALCRRAGNDGLPQAGPVGKERSGLGLHVVLPLGEVELGRDGAHLCIGGRVEAVGSCCTCSERSGSLAVAFFLRQGRNLAVLCLALDDHERVDRLDRLAVVRRQAEHVVEHDSAVWERLGRDEETLAQRARGVGCEQLGKLGADAVGADDYVARGEGEDGLVGKDREALIAGRRRGVDLFHRSEES